MSEIVYPGCDLFSCNAGGLSKLLHGSPLKMKQSASKTISEESSEGILELSQKLSSEKHSEGVGWCKNRRSSGFSLAKYDMK